MGRSGASSCSKSPRTNGVSSSPRSALAPTSEESGSERRCKESCRRRGRPPSSRGRRRKREDDGDERNPERDMAMMGSWPIRLLTRFFPAGFAFENDFRFSLTSSGSEPVRLLTRFFPPDDVIVLVLFCALFFVCPLNNLETE